MRADKPTFSRVQLRRVILDDTPRQLERLRSQIRSVTMRKWVSATIVFMGLLAGTARGAQQITADDVAGIATFVNDRFGKINTQPLIDSLLDMTLNPDHETNAILQKIEFIRRGPIKDADKGISHATNKEDGLIDEARGGTDKNQTVETLYTKVKTCLETHNKFYEDKLPASWAKSLLRKYKNMVVLDLGGGGAEIHDGASIDGQIELIENSKDIGFSFTQPQDLVKVCGLTNNDQAENATFERIKNALKNIPLDKKKKPQWNECCEAVMKRKNRDAGGDEKVDEQNLWVEYGFTVGVFSLYHYCLRLTQTKAEIADAGERHLFVGQTGLTRAHFEVTKQLAQPGIQKTDVERFIRGILVHSKDGELGEFETGFYDAIAAIKQHTNIKALQNLKVFHQMLNHNIETELEAEDYCDSLNDKEKHNIVNALVGQEITQTIVNIGSSSVQMFVVEKEDGFWEVTRACSFELSSAIEGIQAKIKNIVYGCKMIGAKAIKPNTYAELTDKKLMTDTFWNKVIELYKAYGRNGKFFIRNAGGYAWGRVRAAMAYATMYELGKGLVDGTFAEDAIRTALEHRNLNVFPLIHDLNQPHTRVMEVPEVSEPLNVTIETVVKKSATDAAVTYGKHLTGIVACGIGAVTLVGQIIWDTCTGGQRFYKKTHNYTLTFTQNDNEIKVSGYDSGKCGWLAIGNKFSDATLQNIILDKDDNNRIVLDFGYKTLACDRILYADRMTTTVADGFAEVARTFFRLNPSKDVDGQKLAAIMVVLPTSQVRRRRMLSAPLERLMDTIKRNRD